MRVKVKFFAEYREATGRFTEEIELPEGATVADLLRLLEEKYPRLRGRLLQGDALAEETKVMVNGRMVEWIGGLDARLSDGDTVAIFPPAAGG